MNANMGTPYPDMRRDEAEVPRIPAGPPVSSGSLSGAATKQATARPQASHEPTVDEFLRGQISDLQNRIKAVERAYHDARGLGILNAPVSTVREIVGW